MFLWHGLLSYAMMTSQVYDVVKIIQHKWAWIDCHHEISNPWMQVSSTTWRAISFTNGHKYWYLNSFFNLMRESRLPGLWKYSGEEIILSKDTIVWNSDTSQLQLALNLSLGFIWYMVSSCPQYQGFLLLLVISTNEVLEKTMNDKLSSCHIDIL